MIEQNLSGRRKILPRRIVQRRPALIGFGVDGRTMFEQNLSGRSSILPRRLV